MSIIYKYPLGQPGESFRIPCRHSEQIAHIGMNPEGYPSIWIDHSDLHTDQMHTKEFKLIGTGWEYELTQWKRVGTVIDGPLVWHVLMSRIG